MSKSRPIWWSGWAFLLGGFAFISILQGSDPIAIPASEISAILLAVGLLGLRTRYGKHLSAFGRYSLLLGACGPIVLVIVVAMGLAGILTVTQIEKGLWVLLFGSPAVVLLGLTLFGLDALRSKPMSRFNWLPVIAGFWYPVVYLILASYIFTHAGAYPQQYDTAIQMMFLIQSLALGALGLVLLADTRQEMVSI